jgi:hypothetical protein
MAFLALAAPYIGLAATGVAAHGQYQQGKAQQAQQRLAAIQDEKEANAADVAAQRQASNERRRAKLMRSRALAVAGASGAGISEDPTIENILGDIDDEGEARALDAMWEGDNLALGLRSGAKTRRRMGRAASSAGGMNALATGIGGVSTFAQKYG